MSRFDNLFRADDLDNIIQELVMSQAEAGLLDPDPNDEVSQEQKEIIDELNRTLHKDEWSVVSVLCRTSSSSLSVSQIADFRGRLQKLWSENHTPRNCRESCLLFSFLCLLECGLGGTDLKTVENRIMSMQTLLESNLDDLEEQLRRKKELEREQQQHQQQLANTFWSSLFASQVEHSRPSPTERALSWTLNLISASPTSSRTWTDALEKLQQITTTTTTTDSHDVERHQQPLLNSWLTSLIIASFCVGTHRRQSDSTTITSLTKKNARHVGFRALSVALKSKSRSNGVADALWSLLSNFELEENLSTISPSDFQLAPQVSKWDDVPKVYVGQSHAIKEVGDLLRAKQEGLLPSNKPNILLLFGPSGHGKTELAKNIAKVLRIHHQNQNKKKQIIHNDDENNNETHDEEYFFNLVKQEQEHSGKKSDEDDSTHKDSLLILNMANYCTESSLYSLIDPPSGIVGEGGLIRAIQKNPQMVIVADEFEKSTTLACNNLWLPAFESNGKLASGKDPSLKVPTNDVTFVLTCNICDTEILTSAEAYHAASDDGKKKMREQWVAMCGKKLCDLLQNNAFLPRISKLIPFVPFTESELHKYARLQVQAFQRHQLQRGVQFFYSHQVIEKLSKNIKNFHSRSVDSALLEHMLRLSDAKADALLLTMATEKPRGDNNSSSILYDEPQLSLRSFCGSDELSNVLLGGDCDIESLKEKVSKVVHWMKNNQLLKERRNAMRAAALDKMEQYRILNEQRLQEQEEKRQKQEEIRKRELEEEEKIRKEKERIAREEADADRKRREREEEEDKRRRKAEEEKKEQEEQEVKRTLEQQRHQEKQEILEQQEQRRKREEEARKQREEQEQEREKERQQAEQERKRLQKQREEIEKQERELKERRQEQEEERLRQEKEREALEEEQRRLREEREKISQPDLVTGSSSSTGNSNNTKLKENLQLALEKQEDKEEEKDLELSKNLKEQVQEDLIENLREQVNELKQENTNLKLEVATLKKLVKNLQTALAISMIVALSFMAMACLFVPFKLVLLTAVLAAVVLNYFVTNFVDIMIAAAEAVWGYLGPRNVGGIVGGFVLWGWLVGNWSVYSAPPCAQVV